MAVLLMLVMVALVIAGLEWNRRRQPWPGATKAARGGVQDRDLERMQAELQAAADREPTS